MRLSNSKKQLAKIIHENGSWRDGANFSAQDKNASVTFFVDAPWRCGTTWECENFEAVDGFCVTEMSLKHWHQTILSRDEYFHLYPVAETEAEPAPEPVVETKPTIEQLAADYRNAKDYADRKQQEADDAKADAEAKLAELVAAGKWFGLVLSVTAPEPELVITDWRDLRERDVIWFCGDDERGEGEYSVLEVEHRDYGGQRAVRIDTIGNDYWIDVSYDWKFIRRP